MSANIAFAKNEVWQKQNSSLIALENNPSKIPLVLIHGIHGTKSCSEKGNLNPYWSRFRLLFANSAELKLKYSLFIFQYCSDIVGIEKIALELRDLIDENLTDRNHVIVAHSMGGLIAKSYMAETVHLRGKWKGKAGGETTTAIITLATPHHGTPGANAPETLNSHFAFGWENVYKAANHKYWSQAFESETHPGVTDSSRENRSDLRWDNYDFALDAFSGDLNKKLSSSNLLFDKYAAKLIAYSGFLKTTGLDTAAGVFEEIKNIRNEVPEAERNHRLLALANAALYYGLSRRFGETDGLVPFRSGLFCKSEQTISGTGVSLPPKPKNYICKSTAKVRRFEPGTSGEVAKSEYPDPSTLSIYRSGRGYDHLDMLESVEVLNYVLKDLKEFISASEPTSPTSYTIPEIPTLFLMDVSGSMNDGNKIGQAKNAGLSAVGEMQENRRRGQDNSSVAVWTFGGECSPNNIKSLMPLSSNLNQAESVFRNGIPPPDGATPLYTAINLSVDRMTDYLASRADLSEARIVVLTDGMNTCSEQIRPRGVYSQSRNVVYQKIKFYCIGFDIPPGSKEERDLQYLASASGGKYFPARDAAQLNRVFQKVIRIYVPLNSNQDSGGGERAILNRDFENGLKIWTIYIKNNPNDPVGYYNLAVVCEATERYVCATANYKKYQELSENSADTGEIRSRIEKLEEDRQAEFLYYMDVLQSDLEYLKEYYKRLFGLKNDELSAEFAGFVAEKGGFYRNLQEILEIRSSKIQRSSTELADSLDYLNSRVGLASFDRDAVSLLTMPISHLEDLIKNLEEYRSLNQR